MNWVLPLSQVVLLIATFFGLIRLFLGPNTLNRILAFDYICACIIALISVRSIERGTSSYLELILIFSLLGFATVISFMELYFAQQQEETNGT